jgi:hypothetical protein
MTTDAVRARAVAEQGRPSSGHRSTHPGPARYTVSGTFITGASVFDAAADDGAGGAVHPGEQVQMDVKKLGRIPPGGGWRVHGQGNCAHHSTTMVGYGFIHTAIDSYSRLAYSEVLADEKATTAIGSGHARTVGLPHRPSPSRSSRPITARATGPASSHRLSKPRGLATDASNPAGPPGTARSSAQPKPP